VSEQRQELPREAWREFFDTLTKDHEPCDVSIEVLDLDLGDQVEAEKIPLAYVEYDPKDDDFTVGVGGRDGRYPVVLDHIIERPQRILVDVEAPPSVNAIDVFDGDGRQTVVALHPRAALPA